MNHRGHPTTLRSHPINVEIPNSDTLSNEQSALICLAYLQKKGCFALSLMNPSSQDLRLLGYRMQSDSLTAASAYARADQWSREDMTPICGLSMPFFGSMLIG